MSNNFFQFKQFTIQQDQCAMKVCTDACIFGAFLARQLNEKEQRADTILDIGTGTGILSLMLAQKTKAKIDGIEMDEAAFEQAKNNFQRSPWTNRLNIFNADARLFYPGKKYDCIISNPPFFEGDLKSGNKKRNSAKHETSLTLEQLLAVINEHLSQDGFFAVLLPFHRTSLFIKIAMAVHYFLNGQLLLQHTKKHPFFRCILFFSPDKTPVISNKLVIKNAEGKYTADFIHLLKDYYLNL